MAGQGTLHMAVPSFCVVSLTSPAPVDLRVPSLFSVESKIVLITGGSSGIGKMMALGFARNGAKVYLAARKEKQLQDAAEEIGAMSTGGRADYIVANIGSKAGCEMLVAEFRRREDKLHVLINNSGTSWGGPFTDFPEEGWDNVFSVNVKSIFYLTAGLSDLLSKGATNLDPGRVINISSIGSVDPASEGPLSSYGNGTWSYQPSKAAVNHLTSTLALKLGPQHVTVNAILPGLFPSRMTAFGLRTASPESFLSRQPTGRYGQASDIAGLALFYASPASAHITGTHTILDGGARYLKEGIAATAKL